MKFKSEEEHLTDPDASRIPKAIFEKYGFFNKTFDKENQDFMRVQSLEELRQLSRGQQSKIIFSKIRSLICIIYGRLQLNSDALTKVALEDLGLSEEVIFQICALTGKLEILRKFAAKRDTSQLKVLLKSNYLNITYSSFWLACFNDQHEAAELILSLASDEAEKKAMLKGDWTYPAFRDACRNGHQATVQWLLGLVSGDEDEKKAMLKGGDGYEAFSHACMNGHQAIAQELLSLVSDEDEKKAMLKGYGKYDAFFFACENGHQVTAEWLLSFVSDKAEREAMFKGEKVYNAFSITCSNGHLTTAQWFFNFIQRKAGKKAMLRGKQNYSAFYNACENGHQAIAQWLLSLSYSSELFSHVEQHYLHPNVNLALLAYVNTYLSNLSLQAKDKTKVFDFRDDKNQSRSEQALKGFYVLRYLIRQSMENQIHDLTNQIECLLQIPAIKEFVILNTTQIQLESGVDFANQTNELLHLAANICNETIRGRLLEIPAIRQIAEQNQNDQSTQDLSLARYATQQGIFRNTEPLQDVSQQNSYSYKKKKQC